MLVYAAQNALGRWATGWGRMAHRVRSQTGSRRTRATSRALQVLLSLLLLPAGVACTPKVQVEAPKEPIVINLNVKIEHEIRVKVDDDLEQLFEGDDELF